MEPAEPPVNPASEAERVWISRTPVLAVAGVWLVVAVVVALILAVVLTVYYSWLT